MTATMTGVRSDRTSKLGIFDIRGCGPPQPTGRGASGREPLAPLVFRGPLVADGPGGQPAPGSLYFARTAFAWRSSGGSPAARSHSARARPYSVLAFAALPASSAARAAP